MRRHLHACVRALALAALACCWPALAADWSPAATPAASAAASSSSLAAAPPSGPEAPPVAPPPAPASPSVAAPLSGPAAAAVRAPDPPGEALWGVVSELRFGVLSHDMVFPSPRKPELPNPFHHRFERGANINAEILFVSPRPFRYVLSPRPRIGGSVNTLGYTSYAYADLDWGHQFGFGLFTEGFLGGCVHTGKLLEGNPRWSELGSRFLFHIGLEVGYRAFRHHGVSIFWDHISNSALAAKNQGQDSLGLRYGYRFDAK